MQIALCDDDNLYLQTVQKLIETWKNESPASPAVQLQTFRSTEDLLNAWDNGRFFHMVFLDIQIPGEMSGMELARELRSRDSQLQIVFITNYSQYVYNGYEVGALRYIQKPVKKEQLFECLDIAYRQWNLHQDTALLLDTNKEKIRLLYKEILYLEISGHYITIRTVDGTEYYVRNTIEKMQQLLPEDLFIRCHRSYLVNLMYIRKLSRSSLILTNEKQIPVGVRQRENLESRFMDYYQGSGI